jgi:GTP cyclohydrolase II
MPGSGQPGGDQAATYFERTECVAGVQDARFQQLMPDVIHWLGIERSTASSPCPT